MLPLSTPYWCSLFLLVLSITSHLSRVHSNKTDDHEATFITLEMRDTSFMLYWTLLVNTEDGSKTAFDINEMHSGGQKRSMLHYKSYHIDPIAKVGKIETIYSVGQQQQQLLLVEPGQYSCSKADKGYDDRLFNENTLTGFYSGHLIGAARLLSFVQANHDKFTTLRPPIDIDKTSLPYKKMFWAEFKVGTVDEFVITLFYHRELSYNLPHGLPRTIVIKTKSQTQIVYDFTRYKPLEGSSNLFQPREGSSSNLAEGLIKLGLAEFGGRASDEIVFDVFALERAIGCSKVLRDFQGNQQQDRQHSDPRLLRFDSFRFSFTAQLEDPYGTGQSSSLAVAYEPKLSTLRTELVRPQGGERITSITDFYYDRRYHVVKRAASLGPVADGIFRSNNSDKQDDSKSCVVEIVHHDEARELWRPFSSGKMLLGTNRLVYLGLARVRGIEARVFESHECDLPIWLQPPSVFEEQQLVAEQQQESGHSNTTTTRLSQSKTAPLFGRDESKLIKKRGLTNTCVIYFTNPGPNQDELLQAKLLLVEVFTKIDSTGSTLKHQSFPIHDFTWAWSSTNPAGGRYEDWFSLQNECLAEMDREQYATIELTMEARRGHLKEVQWIHERSKRNMALLVQLSHSDMILMSPMVFDIESKLVDGEDDDGKGGMGAVVKPSLVMASLRVAERAKAIDRLVFIGMAFMKHERVEIYETHNFQLCYLMAATRHAKLDTLFGYEPVYSQCYLAKAEVFNDAQMGAALDEQDPLRKLMNEVCKITEDGVVEVYQILHQERVYRQPRRSNHLAAAGEAMKQRKFISLLDPTSNGFSSEGSAWFIDMEIKNFRIGSLNDKINDDLGELHLVGANTIHGCGLVVTSSSSNSGTFRNDLNKLVELNKLDSEDPNLTAHRPSSEMMSFEHCQTACLADLECRSFSICPSRQGKMRCVLSGVSFSTPSLTNRLMGLINRAKFGDRFSIDVDLREQESYLSSTLAKANNNSELPRRTVTVHLVKHPGCELHKKLYRDLFKLASSHSGLITTKSELIPVVNSEHCAELCFRATLDSILFVAKDHLDQQSSRGHIAPAACNFFQYVAHNSIALLRPATAAALKRLVLDEESSNQQHEDHNEQQQANNGAGYCYLDGRYVAKDDDDGQTQRDRLSYAAKLGLIESDFYTFNYVSLFTKQSGVSMVESPLDPNEKLALFASPLNSSYATATVHENYGSLKTTVHAEDCAAKCFRSELRLAFPVCRSFDFIEIDSLPFGSIRRFCAYNSISLKTALKRKRFDLIRYGEKNQVRVPVSQPNEKVRVWHYEPRNGLALTSDDTYKILSAEDRQNAASDYQASQLKKTTKRTTGAHVQLGATGLVCVVLVALSLGLVTGLTLGSRWSLATANCRQPILKHLEVPDLSDIQLQPQNTLATWE